MNYRVSVFLVLIIMIVGACKDDDSVTCTQCNSPQTMEFQVCRESSGNASVNGEDTGTNYDLYITGLEEAGTTCGG